MNDLSVLRAMDSRLLLLLSLPEKGLKDIGKRRNLRAVKCSGTRMKRAGLNSRRSARRRSHLQVNQCDEDVAGSMACTSPDGTTRIAQVLGAISAQ